MEDYLPTDAFVEILLRLPPFTRRRFRLVCRRWRDLLDERTPRIHARVKPLAFFTRGRHAAQLGSSSAYVYDDDDLSGEFVCCRQVWCGGAAAAAGLVMFGCRNGILAMVDDRTGDITLANPATGETLAVPPPPRLPRNCAFHRAAVGFGYHPTTGKYKIVHLPPLRGEASALGVVEVFTLRRSNATWREVAAAPPPAGSSCDVGCGLVSVDGAMYWIAMSFDLEHERVARVTSLPAMARGKLAAGRCCHLTVIRRRLAVAITASDVTVVWVLHKGRRKQRWINQYRVVGMDTYHKQLTRPYFFFSHGEHYMTITWRFPYISMRAHRLKKGDGEPKEMALLEQGASIQVFSYAETTETLR
uniref:F-box domain-containing protein n=1 Tax=Oryza glumipatula TaxID=40148 RepID=A0A0E0BSX7_9ORYZ